jgi:tetratricopeptide (TPR) repeat protein
LPGVTNALLKWGALPALALAIVLIYGQTISQPFLLDDFYCIVENPGIHRLWPLTAALNPPPRDLTFFTRPFVNLTMCVDYAIGGPAPRGYHRTSTILHMAVALALFGLVCRTLQVSGYEASAARKLGFAAALLWAVHPLNTTAVNYLSQRGELCVGLFLFLMLYSLNRAAEIRPAEPRALHGGTAASPSEPCPDETGSRPTRAWILAAFLACLLGMGSKENMLVAPFLAAAYDRIFLAGSWREVFRRRRWFYAAVMLTGLWPLSRILTYSPHLPKAGFSSATIGHYLLTQAWGLARMIRLVFWPSPLIFDYGTTLISDPWRVWPHALFLLGLLGLTAWALIRRPRAGFAGLVFFALLAPSALLPITGQPVAEHRMYTPMAALISLAVTGIALAGRRSKWNFRPGLAALILGTGVLGGMTAHRNSQYRTSLSLTEDTVRKQPGNARAWQNLGVFHQEAGHLERALEAYSRSLELNPAGVKALANRALIRFELGQWEAALDDLNGWLRIEPASADALLRRAVVWDRLGDPVQSEQDSARALAAGHASAHHLNNLAWLLATRATVLDPPRALELARRAVEISGRDYRILDTLAAAHAAAGQFEQACAVTIEARDQARSQKDLAFTAKLERRLEQYRKNDPWREDSP